MNPTIPIHFSSTTEIDQVHKHIYRVSIVHYVLANNIQSGQTFSRHALKLEKSNILEVSKTKISKVKTCDDKENFTRHIYQLITTNAITTSISTCMSIHTCSLYIHKKCHSKMASSFQ